MDFYIRFLRVGRENMTDVEERVTRWKEGRGGGGRYAKEGQGGRRDEESEKK